ncbi:MAG TPA: hypothetical protein VF676_03860 [Flavobacterium sp.]|jgi:hypothetical protein
METHFEGSRGSEHMTSPHQRQYDEQNPDNVNHMETDNTDNLENPQKDVDLASQVVDHPEDVDSGINTQFGDNSDSTKSLTPDEKANTNPNDVDNKPSFNRNETL